MRLKYYIESYIISCSFDRHLLLLSFAESLSKIENDYLIKQNINLFSLFYHYRIKKKSSELIKK